MLSQDAYGAETLISLRTSAFPVPDLAVGRLVETPAEIAGLLDAYTAGRRRRRAGLVARDGLRLPRRRSRAPCRQSFEAGHGRRRRPARHAGRQVPAGSSVLDREPARDEAARQPPRRDLPRRPLQRQQRARGRLHDEPAHDRPGRLAGQPRQLDRLQRRLPRGLQPRRRRRRDGRDVAARLGAGVRAKAGDADRRNRLPVRRHRLPRVQRAALPRLRPPAARRHGRRVGRRGARAGEARLPGDDAGPPRPAREGAARDGRVRLADARRQHAGRTRFGCRRRVARSRPSRSPRARPRLSACGPSTSRSRRA